MHWTQTKEGRAKMADLQKKAWKTRRQRDSRLAAPNANGSTADISTRISQRLQAINLEMHDLTKRNARFHRIW